MNLRTLLSVYAVLIALGGIIWLVVPSHLEVYGIEPIDPFATLLARFAGTMAIGLGVIAWFARDAGDRSRDGVVIGLIVTSALGALVCVMGVLAGDVNELGWVPAIAYVIFTLLFLITRRRTGPPSVEVK